MPQIMSVNVSQMDEEIQELENKLFILKGLRQSIKKYAYTKTNTVVADESAVDANGDTENKRFKSAEFILSFIGEGWKTTKELVEGYKSAKGETDFNKAYNNVSNTLTKLKNEGKIKSEAIGEGKRDGYRWGKIKNQPLPVGEYN